MMVIVIWMKTIRLTASVPTNMKESFVRKVGFFNKYDVFRIYKLFGYVIIKITLSFHFILEIECNLTCEHDGICAKDHNDDVQCFCPQGYSGQYCEHGKHISILDIPRTHETFPKQYVEFYITKCVIYSSIDDYLSSSNQNDLSISY